MRVYSRWSVGEFQIMGFVFFFQAEEGIRDYKVTGVQTCALPIYFFATRTCAHSAPPQDAHATTKNPDLRRRRRSGGRARKFLAVGAGNGALLDRQAGDLGDRKSTRLNSSHLVISYAVFCLKKKKL